MSIEHRHAPNFPVIPRGQRSPPPNLAVAAKDLEISPHIRVFLVLGVTGSGITTFIQKATGDEGLSIGNALKSRKPTNYY